MELPWRDLRFAEVKRSEAGSFPILIALRQWMSQRVHSAVAPEASHVSNGVADILELAEGLIHALSLAHLGTRSSDKG
jgi:hypothetical protein